ncbi:MAG TPA: sigma-54 dependent transcriptional regulator [Patescibacteria group bacterium]|nr:sigma-54 dependent transcriptional regulator [Patescibacteria group bacterium]
MGGHEVNVSETSAALPYTESTLVLSLLVASDEDSVREFVRSGATRSGMRVKAASNLSQALGALAREAIDLVVVDLATPSLGGVEFVKRVRQEHPESTVIVLTEFGRGAAAGDAIEAGAQEAVARPFDEAELRAKLERLGRTLALDHENRVLREQLASRPGFGVLVGFSPKMQNVYRMIEKVSRSQSPVLILGETGTGKELVARSIHFHGLRKKGPFVPVDCTGLVPTLVESELFGHVKGAFTGALQAKRGLIESASGGTLFLDEIGEFPLEMQAKLLRILQEREVRPVGATATVAVDIRVVAATNRDLGREVEKGRFRQDLFYRLNVVPIRVPPLRERKSDIPLIANHFLERWSRDERPTPVFSEDAMARLVAYDWPGNVRELENAVSRAAELNSGSLLSVGDLPTNLQSPAPARLPLDDEQITLAELERRAIFRALAKTRGDKMAAARLLGIGKTTLYRKLKQYGDGEPDGSDS